VRSRLARAREKLRRGLTRRGVVLPAVALTAALSARSARASVSSFLCDTTTRAAICFVARHAAVGSTSVSVTALAREVLRSMLIHKLKFIALTFLFLGAVATGTGYWTRSPAMIDEPRGAPASRPQPLAATPESALPGRMIVAGRVLDPAGKPIVGVPVDIIGRARKPWIADDERKERHVLLGRGTTDDDGRIRIDASRSSLVGFFEVHALAAAPGLGLGWAQLNADAEQPTAEIRLRPEQVIRGKLVDVSGQPAARVELRIHSVGRPTNIGTFDGVNLGLSRPPEGLRAWPRPVTTDDQGRFTLPGIGRDVTVAFGTGDLRFASQSFRIQTDDRDGPKDVTLALHPATTVAGRALAADTGQPIPHAVVEVASGQDELRLGSRTRFRADDQGRFTANVGPGTYFQIQAFPPEGAPYLVSRQEFQGPKGTVKMVRDIPLIRGVVIRGTVAEHGTGRPLGGASVQYLPARSRDDVLSGYPAVVASKDDGSYQIVVLPARGTCSSTARGPTTSSRRSADGRSIPAGPAGSAIMLIRSFPTTSRTATRRARSPSHSGRARRSRAVSWGRRGRPSRTPRSSRSFTSTTSTSTGAATSRSTLATAGSSCTGSTPRSRRASRSWTPITSGVRRSSSPANKPARR
jgi:hypothetical protein